MHIVLIIIVLLLALVFGVGFITDSFAHARQAQATIEVAKVAQTQAVTNMISVLVLAVLVLVLVIVLLGLFLLAIRFLQQKSTQPAPISRPRRRWTPGSYALTANDMAGLPVEHQTTLEQSQPVLMESLEPDDFDNVLERWLNE